MEVILIVSGMAMVFVRVCRCETLTVMATDGDVAVGGSAGMRGGMRSCLCHVDGDGVMVVDPTCDPHEYRYNN